MREIKFRARNRVTGEIIYNIGIVNRLDEMRSDWDELDFYQYIGKDKNGVEIYEGNIVSSITGFDICNSYHEESFEREVVGVVSLTTSKGAVLNRPKYRESTEGDYLPDLEFKKFSYAYSFAVSNSKVLGNIWDNPELIK